VLRWVITSEYLLLYAFCLFVVLAIALSLGYRPTREGVVSLKSILSAAIMACM
jgi:hypothetical protein